MAGTAGSQAAAVIVVADAGPLSYVLQIEAEHVLPALFELVVVPRAVVTELTAPGTPQAIRSFMTSTPSWLLIADAPAEGVAKVPGRLGAGEIEAIALAADRHASLLVDDLAAWKTAQGLGVQTIRTLALLQIAAERGHLDLLQALDRLAATTFYVTPDLMLQVRQAEIERRARISAERSTRQPPGS